MHVLHPNDTAAPYMLLSPAPCISDTLIPSSHVIIIHSPAVASQDPGSGPTAEELMWQQMGPDDDSSSGYSRGGWVAGGGYDRPERVSDVMGRKTNMQWRIQLPGETGEGLLVLLHVLPPVA